MKCYEIRQCNEEERGKCYVWNSLRDNPEDMENVKCWVVKGAYQQENREQLQRCRQCKYYLMMNRDSGVVSDHDAELAVITCEGVINNDRTKALEKVWEGLKRNNKHKVVLKVANVSNVYSCGLGVLIKIHKETAGMGGFLVVEGAAGYVQALFESTKLNKILNITTDSEETRQLVAGFKEKEEQAAQEVAEPEPAQPPKERVPCYVYWENHNPKNATSCDECFRKIKPTDEPCWIVEGMIEGVSFQYVNEDCEDCAYFQEFGTH